MKLLDLKSQIFLDSGDPAETKKTLEMLGFLDGQTTNPSLVAKNPAVQERLSKGRKFSREEIYAMYKKIVQEISALIPDGSVSVEVYTDLDTSVEEMVQQAKEMNTWISNAHIKLPVGQNGLKAGEILVREGIKINMTLVFTQEQAAAVYQATRSAGSGQARGAKKGQVFLSPFIGRLDDCGENGMDYIKNVVEMYKSSDHHVEILAASVRSLDHLLYSLQLGCDIITAPFKILEQWAGTGLQIPDSNYVYPADNLKPISYREVLLNKNWQEYDIKHELTDSGIKKFCRDWNNLIK